MIYFDNAATGGFKPYGSIEAAANTMKFLNANPGRSGHRLSTAGAQIVFNARRELASFFNCDNIERVIFTKNCTEALNLAIMGTLKKGGHVVTTENEHNSVLRPLYKLQEDRLITLSVAKVAQDGRLDYENLAKLINDDTYLVVMNQISNVTGTVNDVFTVKNIIKKKNILLAVDAAQSAGHIPIDMAKDGIDILCFAGHKGMCAIPGSGGLLFNENIDVEPIMFGGTGTESFSPTQPKTYPEKLESGTLNLPAIASLYEGAVFMRKNLAAFAAVLNKYTDLIIKKLSRFKDITVVSQANPAGIVSFYHREIPSQEIAQSLSDNFDIAVRAGLHCAPLIHKRLKTDKDGLVRVSLCAHNSVREINYFTACLSRIIS